MRRQGVGKHKVNDQGGAVDLADGDRRSFFSLISVAPAKLSRISSSKGQDRNVLAFRLGVVVLL